MRATASAERIRIAGIPVDCVSSEDFEAVIEGIQQKEKVSQIALVTLWDILKARHNREYREMLERSDLVIPISKGILKAARFVKKTVPQRYMPFDFVIRLLGYLESKHQSIYLLGGNEDRILVAEQNVRETFPNLRLVGRYRGGYPKEREKDILTAIKKASPAVTLAGRGLKGKDCWVLRNRSKFNPGIFIWSQDTLDVFSGRRKRGSRSLFDKGLEFLPGLFKRPWRLLRSFLYFYLWIALFVQKVRKE